MRTPAGRRARRRRPSSSAGRSCCTPRSCCSWRRRCNLTADTRRARVMSCMRACLSTRPFKNARKTQRAPSQAMADPAAKKRRLEAMMGGGGGGAGGGGDAGPSGTAPPAPESAASAARSPFEASANEALSFRLVRTAAELATAPSFHPEFTHQVFREDETIFGYRDLQARAFAAAHCVAWRAAWRASRAAAGVRAVSARQLRGAGWASSSGGAGCAALACGFDANARRVRRSPSRCTRSPSTRW
jgi:hypothetical protein